VINKPALSKVEREKFEKIQRRMERAQHLASIIKLEPRNVDLLEQQPKTEYELYMQSFGKTNHVQASVQCPIPEERTEAEVQTEKTVKMSRAVEAIPHKIFSEVERELRKKRGGGSDSSLAKFLKNSAIACEILLEENNVERKKRIEGEKASIWKFSKTFTTFYHGIITANRKVVGKIFLTNELTHI
jgi:hypothetical protein